MLSQLIAENNGTDTEVLNSDNLFVSWGLATKCSVGITLILIIFLAVVGNFLVCAAIYSDRRLRKLSNLFIVSLSVADLLVSLLVMPFALVNDLLGYWTFGSTFCNIWIAFDVMGSTASILNLCAISLDRFIHIKDPLRYNRWVRKSILLAAIAVIWMMSALISFLPINLGWHKPKEIASNITIYSKPICGLDLTPTYATVSSFISFYAPCIIMVFLYSRLFVYAKRHARHIKATMAAPIPLMKNGVCESKTVSSNYQAMEHKAAITLGVIVGTFLICWVPFFCVNIVAAVCKSCITDNVFKILTWLGYCNSALNPIIYSIFNTEFRDAFRRILFVHCRGICCWYYSDLATRNMRKNYMNSPYYTQRSSEPTTAETTVF